MEFLFGNMDDMPEELRAAIEQHQMHNDHTAHEVEGFFESLNEEQLRSLRTIMKIASANPNAIDYFVGLMAGHMRFRYGVCNACGKKHEEELKNLSGQAEHTSTKADEYAEKLAEYGVTRLDDDKVQCFGCGMVYSSLSDRMLRKPGASGCTGCQQKAAWG